MGFWEEFLSGTAAEKHFLWAVYCPFPVNDFFIEHVGQNLQTIVRLECEMAEQRPVKSYCDGSYRSAEDEVPAHPS